MRNILTIDIEDWYQSSIDILGPKYSDISRPVPPSNRVIKNTRNLLKIMKEYEVTATCFILGTVAEAYPGLVKEIHEAGHEVATHGYGHELVYKLEPKQFMDDVVLSIDILESITNEKVKGYRAPYFSITPKSEWALEKLVELGVEYDSSIFPIRRELYGFPKWDRFPHIITKTDGNFQEFPISTIKILGRNIPVSGGGYFRIFPYNLTRYAIKLINRQKQPAIFYLHPYEIDINNSEQQLPIKTRRTNYLLRMQMLNRSRTESKLRKLLNDFDWVSIKDWLNQESSGFNKEEQEIVESQLRALGYL